MSLLIFEWILRSYICVIWIKCDEIFQYASDDVLILETLHHMQAFLWYYNNLLFLRDDKFFCVFYMFKKGNNVVIKPSRFTTQKNAA